MSNSRPTSSSTSSSRARSNAARIVAQTSVDATLDAQFETLGTDFDYSKSISHPIPVTDHPRRSEKVTAYLQHIQRGKFIQPFGCLLAVDEKTFRVIAFSANAPDMLTMVSHQVPSDSDRPALGVGTDIRFLFTAPSTAALQKALGFAEVSLLNPILVHCKTSGKPFYAIVHRVTHSLIIDFEPVNQLESPTTAAGALQSYKLAAKAIAKLQMLPGGSVKKLCETVVQEVFELTGYDRVMAYRFHDDDHGEVFAEQTKPGLEPYLGLHYPATDIPQAARFLFMKNKVRMICDCHSRSVEIYQDEKLPAEITFCGSTLRAPHSCHLQYMANMNSVASLVMAVVVNEGEMEGDEQGEQPQQQSKRKRLWGLVVCHHLKPRFVPFPLRYACEFLMQVFAIHVHKEFELENQILEKNILRTQTLLCDMLLRDGDPIGIVSQSPNIMDLVKCDGAALLYKNRIWQLGMTPSGSQIRDIALWLSEHHPDSTGLSTDSLLDAGYPAALALGDTVCGMAAARITSNDIVFWFRAHTAAEINWGGAKHDPKEEDDGRKMHPRSSFCAFLQVVKDRSLPWNDHEMDAIHSIQLILRGTFDDNGKKRDSLDSRISEMKLEGMVELQAVTNEMVRLIETATVPILAVDVDGLINGWNLKVAELTGLPINDAMGKHLLTLVEDCSVDRVHTMLHLALKGEEEKNVQFQMKTYGPCSDEGPVILNANACANRDLNGNIVGVCFVAQDMTGHKLAMDKFTKIQGDYKAIMQNPNPLIPPIFGADEFGWCSEWNLAMTKLTGWKREDVMDKMLLGEVFGTTHACCRMTNLDGFVTLSIIINNAMMGKETEKVPFAFIRRNGMPVECLLSVSKKGDAEVLASGALCFLHLTSHEMQQLLHVQQLSEQTTTRRLKALAYMRHEVANPLSGITYSRKMLEGTDLSETQKQFVSTEEKCHHQLDRILDDFDLENFMDSSLDLDMSEFALQDVVVTAINQVMIPSTRKGVRIMFDLSDRFMTEHIYGDNVRLQQIFADFLFVSVKFSPNGGLVQIASSLIKNQLSESLQLVHLEFRITHTGSGVPEELLYQMFGNHADPSSEGISLLVCRKLVRLMNGEVRYVREASHSTFIITVELASASMPKGRITSNEEPL